MMLSHRRRFLKSRLCDTTVERSDWSMAPTSWLRLYLRGMLLTMTGVSFAAGGCEREAERSVAASVEWRDFEGSWNAAGIRRTIPLGIDRTSSIIHLRGTMLLAGAGRPGVGFLADVIALTDSGTGLVGRGVWTDEHGDQVFSELKGEGTKEQNHIVGTILGGTGRFRGVTGTYEFSWQYVIESGDDSVQGRTLGLKGRYRIDQPTSVGETR